MSEADLRRIVQELNEKAKDDSDRPVSVHYVEDESGRVSGARIESQTKVLFRFPEGFRGLAPLVSRQRALPGPSAANPMYGLSCSKAESHGFVA